MMHAVGAMEEETVNDTSEFSDLVESHKRRIYCLALDLTGNHHDAEDLTQESFIKAYQALQRFRGESQVGTWLHRITVNTFIDRRRKKSEEAMRNQESWDDQESRLRPMRDSHPSRNPERSTASADIQKHIDSALNRLSDQQRSVFVLRHYQELKLREIAEVLGLSEGTIKTVLFRAIRRLQEELDFYRPHLGLEN